MDALLDFELLSLLAVANGVPLFAKRFFGEATNRALDGGARWHGKPVFGPSKTIRGIATAFVATPVVALLLGLPALIGLIVALGAMAGDLISSFVKRRLGMPSSSQAPGLDQIPESLLPALLVTLVLPITALDIIVTVLVFMIFEVVLSRILFQIGFRDQPY